VLTLPSLAIPRSVVLPPASCEVSLFSCSRPGRPLRFVAWLGAVGPCLAVAASSSSHGGRAPRSPLPRGANALQKSVHGEGVPASLAVWPPAMGGSCSLQSCRYGHGRCKTKDFGCALAQLAADCCCEAASASMWLISCTPGHAGAAAPFPSGRCRRRLYGPVPGGGSQRCSWSGRGHARSPG